MQAPHLKDGRIISNFYVYTTVCHRIDIFFFLSELQLMTRRLTSSKKLHRFVDMTGISASENIHNLVFYYDNMHILLGFLMHQFYGDVTEWLEL